ncbi:MAG: sulfotransferase domain-containing protein [Bacteroidetes bacterium]|nr:sulfotransferase domain-containing protein [Bacteroidota bacterium]
MNKKIDVMIVGAQKAGTTSLLRYLGEHPECISHPQKEFAYFTDTNEYQQGIEVALKKYYSHSPTGNKKIIAKNASLYTSDLGLRRLIENNPACKIILLLRNPVERTYSSYLMEKNYGSAKFDFSELPELIKKHQDTDESWGFNFFINYGLYAQHLKNIYSFFPKEQVTVILYRDLKKDALKECQNIFRKAHVNADFKPNVELKHNVTKKTRSEIYARLVHRFLHNENPIKKAIKRIIPGHKAYKYGELLREVNKTDEKHQVIDSEVKHFLIDYYKPHNDELEKLIDKDLSDWNK